MNPTSYGDSPYQSPASVAGNPYYIDLDILHKKGLFTHEELKGAVHNTKRVDYGWLFGNRYPLLRKAYARFLKKGAEEDAFNKFCKANKNWIDDYGLFMALKVGYGYLPWTMWQDEDKDVTKARKSRKTHEKESGFWKWLQFEFFTQWQALKKYANDKGIVTIGDMPIYKSIKKIKGTQSSAFLIKLIIEQCKPLTKTKSYVSSFLRGVIVPSGC